MARAHLQHHVRRNKKPAVTLFENQRRVSSSPPSHHSRGLRTVYRQYPTESRRSRGAQAAAARLRKRTLRPGRRQTLKRPAIIETGSDAVHMTRLCAARRLGSPLSASFPPTGVNQGREGCATEGWAMHAREAVRARPLPGVLLPERAAASVILVAIGFRHPSGDGVANIWLTSLAEPLAEDVCGWAWAWAGDACARARAARAAGVQHYNSRRHHAGSNTCRILAAYR